MVDLLAAHRHTSRNWVEIGASNLCGCCNCMQIFPADDIVAWSGLDMNNMEDQQAVDAQTALCPRCGSEAVIGDKSGYPIAVRFLGMMNEAWFQKTIIRKPAPRK